MRSRASSAPTQSLKRLAEDVAVERQNAKLPDDEHDEL